MIKMSPQRKLILILILLIFFALFVFRAFFYCLGCTALTFTYWVWPSKIYSLPAPASKPIVPKIIHQTWKTNEVYYAFIYTCAYIHSFLFLLSNHSYIHTYILSYMYTYLQYLFYIYKHTIIHTYFDAHIRTPDSKPIIPKNMHRIHYFISVHTISHIYIHSIIHTYIYIYTLYLQSYTYMHIYIYIYIYI